MSKRLRYLSITLGLTLCGFTAQSQTAVIDSVSSPKKGMESKGYTSTDSISSYINNIGEHLDSLRNKITVLGSMVNSRKTAAVATVDSLGNISANHGAVPFHVDTLHVTPAMITKLQQEQPVNKYEMELKGVTFVPKGQWVTGIAVSYSQTTQNDYQFLILQNISGDTYSFKVSPMLCYIFKNDMGAGGKFSYTRSLTKLEHADVVLDPETNYGTEYLYSLAHNYSVTAILRNYFSLGQSRRFGVFTELQLKLGGGQSKITTGRGEDLSGAYERNYQVGVGLAPGLAVFLSNYSAIEVNVGVLGFNMAKTKTINDQIYVSRRKSQSANFRINLFSITFGVAFYI